jgi:uncharacterized RmlC-like cupin family protein
VNIASRCYISVRESLLLRLRAQAMAEHAFILAAVAVTVDGAYALIGKGIGFASGVNSDLTNTHYLWVGSVCLCRGARSHAHRHETGQ